METTSANCQPSFQSEHVSTNHSAAFQVWSVKLSFRYGLVVKETIATYREMVMAEGWTADSQNQLSNFNEIPKKVRLLFVRPLFSLIHFTPPSAGIDHHFSLWVRSACYMGRRVQSCKAFLRKDVGNCFRNFDIPSRYSQMGL